MDKRTIASWCLYDFGNSAFAVLFPFVFGQYYAEDVVGGTTGTQWWGYTTSLSMLCVALSAPFVGGIADHAGVRKRLLGVYTLVGIAAVLGFAGVREGMLWTGFLLGVLANLAFEGGIVFYNAYLPEIAPPTHHGRISAAGFAVGYVGSLVAIGLAALLQDYQWIWIALALQWGLFALPLFLFLPPDARSGLSVPAAAREGLRGTTRLLKEVLGMRHLRRFLLAYFFYMDGVNTVIFFAGVYTRQQLGFTLGESLLLIALIQVTALAGSLAMGPPTDRLGPRWVVRRVLLWWIGVVTAAFFVNEEKWLFWIVAVLAGLGIGSIQASSRAFMSRLIPEGREAEFFGFYALCGKTGAILGPLVFGAVSGAANQRWAVLSVAFFYLAGFLLLGRVRAGPQPAARSP